MIERYSDINTGVIFVDAFVTTRLLMDEVHKQKKSTFRVYDLSDTNYKFMDQKMYF